MTSTPPPEAPAVGLYRPGGVRGLAVVWWALATFLLVDLLRRGGTDASLTALAAALLLLSCAVVHALFWQPAVRVDARAVELVNVLRVVRLPWAAVTDLDTRWALSVEADGRRHTAWAAPASGRRVRPVSRRETPWAEPGAAAIAGSRAPGSSAGEAAVMVAHAWQTWRELPAARRRADAAPQQGAAVSVRWNRPVVVALATSTALLVLAVGWVAA